MSGVTNSTAISTVNGCFERDEFGKEIIKFNDLPVDFSFVLWIHFIVNTLVCSSAVIANLLLVYLILRSKSNVLKLRPVIWFNCIAGLITGFVHLIAVRFVHIGYGRYLSWCNGIHITNRLVSGILIVLASQTALFIWTAMPLQCIYRYSIVKTGNRPQGFKLFIYIVLTLTSFFLQFYMSFATIDVSDANFSLRHDSTEILRHVGYSLNESEIHGIFRSSPSWISPTKMAITIITYSIVIYCIVMIRKFLRNRSLTKATKRLNRDMDLMLSCLAITPLISTLVPYVLVVTRIRSCENDEMINFFISILPQLTELISASSTIYWVRPYREILLNMFGLKKINNHVIESVQVTVRPTPTFNQLTN